LNSLLPGCILKSMCHHLLTSNRAIILSEPLRRVVDTQVKSGRFKNASAAVQEAVWSFFVGPNSPFEEYQVTPRQVDRAAARDLAAINKDRQSGRLKPWKP
jgi:hypothetical protein